MIRSIRSWLVVAMLAALGAPLAAATPQVEIAYDTDDRPSVRILQNYTLRANDTARDVLVIAGDARIEGRVTEDVVVVLGKVEVASTAVVEGSFVVVAGTAQIADGAKVNRDFVVVGGAETSPNFSPGGQHVVIGTAGLGEAMRSLVPWLTSGLLLGRPIVPGLGWVWLVAGVFFFLNLCLNLLFDAPVRSCATTLRTTPFSAFMAGLLVMLLAGPVCVLLAISVIGIAVIPFVLCALLAAGVLGRIGFARWIGMSLLPQSDPADRGQSLRSFAIGSALMCAAYMIPFLGFVVWILAGVFGLGSATLAFYSSYRARESEAAEEGGSAAGRASRHDCPWAPRFRSRRLGSSSLQAGDSQPLPQADAVNVNLPPEGVNLPPEGVATELPTLSSHPTRSRQYPGVAQGDVRRASGGAGARYDRHFHRRAVPRSGSLLGGSNERLVLLLALAYHVGFWTWRGTTLGGMICQLRVVRTDGRKLEFPGVA